MTNAPFRYIREKKALVEEARMEKPNGLDIFLSGITYSYTKNEIELYENYLSHIAYLKSIPTDYEGWEDKPLVEGVDFEVNACCDYKCDGTCEQINSVLKAVPLNRSQPIEKVELFTKEDMFHAFIAGEKFILKANQPFFNSWLSNYINNKGK